MLYSHSPNITYIFLIAQSVTLAKRLLESCYKVDSTNACTFLTVVHNVLLRSNISIISKGNATMEQLQGPGIRVALLSRSQKRGLKHPLLWACCKFRCSSDTQK